MKTAIFFLILFLNSTFLFSQNVKKETISFYKELYKVDTNDVKNGKHLELAKNFTMETFISYYLEHGKERDTKKYGIQTITQLYSDTEFIYFGKTYAYGLLDFFKVSSNDLKNINLDKLDGNEIRDRFIKQIIPQSDKDKVKRKETGCSSTIENPKFTYQYQKGTNDILITYRWKKSCDFIKIINKTYIARLNLIDYQLKK